mgnify:CR=1 FL=1
MKLGFRRKLFLSSMLLIFLVALPSGFYLQSALQQWSQEQISAELERQVETVRVLVEETSRLSSDRRAFSTTVHRVAAASTSAIQVIDEQGNVLTVHAQLLICQRVCPLVKNNLKVRRASDWSSLTAHLHLIAAHARNLPVWFSSRGTIIVQGH